MNNWKEYKLGDLVAINERSIGRNYRYERVEYIDTSSVTENKFETPIYSAITEAPSRAKRLIADGDTIISTVRPIQKHYGFIKKAKENQVVSTGFAVVTPKSIEPRFLYYFLTQAEITEYLNTIAEGGTTTFPAFKPDELKELSICLPHRDTQTAIAEILSSLDDKIELNNKINQELENLAQTLFKRWFVDFDFPNENGEPYKSSGGEMVECELGEIPKGWTTEVLSEATKLIRGISYRKPELVLKDEGIAFVNLKCFSINGTFRQDGIKYYNGKYKNEQILCNNDILVAVTDLTQDREIIGMPILWNGSTTALPSLDTCIIRSERLELKNFLYYEFKTKRYKSRIIEHANGSTVLHLSVKGLETYVFPMPNESLLKNWSAIIQPILETINSNINEIIELSKTRDYLLPKLISGELKINEITN